MENVKVSCSYLFFASWLESSRKKKNALPPVNRSVLLTIIKPQKRWELIVLRGKRKSLLSMERVSLLMWKTSEWMVNSKVHGRNEMAKNRYGVHYQFATYSKLKTFTFEGLSRCSTTPFNTLFVCLFIELIFHCNLVFSEMSFDACILFELKCLPLRELKKWSICCRNLKGSLLYIIYELIPALH